MSTFSADAILLRRRDFQDNDLIVTLLTRERGRLSAIARSAKKSRRRFGGILEPFSRLNIVCRYGRGALPTLLEASLVISHAHIRTDIFRAAHAGYWAELVEAWLEEKVIRPDVFDLLDQSLGLLDGDGLLPEILGLRFQMNLLKQAGVFPNLMQCVACGRSIDALTRRHLSLSPHRGGIVCRQCGGGDQSGVILTKGSINQLLWLTHCTPDQARRLRFSETSLRESTAFVEAFTSFHLGRSPKSLVFLKQIRGSAPKHSANG